MTTHLNRLDETTYTFDKNGAKYLYFSIAVTVYPQSEIGQLQQETATEHKKCVRTCVTHHNKIRLIVSLIFNT